MEQTVPGAISNGHINILIGLFQDEMTIGQKRLVIRLKIRNSS